jgi:hypothetical protein
MTLVTQGNRISAESRSSLVCKLTRTGIGDGHYWVSLMVKSYELALDAIALPGYLEVAEGIP